MNGDHMIDESAPRSNAAEGIRRYARMDQAKRYEADRRRTAPTQPR